jgi:hypothetical protein
MRDFGTAVGDGDEKGVLRIHRSPAPRPVSLIFVNVWIQNAAE